MVSVISASRYHPRYQSTSSMYIRDLIPRIFAELAEAVPIGTVCIPYYLDVDPHDKTVKRNIWVHKPVINNVWAQKSLYIVVSISSPKIINQSN